MLHSKATAALMRLKEIDRKYKVRQADNDRRRLSPSSESSLGSASQSEHRLPEQEESLVETPLKRKTSRLDIQMPEAHFGKSNDDDDDNNENAERERPPLVVLVNVSPRKSEDDSVRSNRSALMNNSKLSSLEVPSSIAEVYEEAVAPADKGEESNKISEPATAASIGEEESYAPSNESCASGANTSSASLRSNTKLSPNTTNVAATSTVIDEPSIEYDNDTFEEISSATRKTSISRVDRERRDSSETSVTKEISNGGSGGIKWAKISLRVSTKQSTVQGVGKRSSDTELIELVSPKITESQSQCAIDLHKELSAYVKKVERVDIDSRDFSPVRLLKSPKSPPSSTGKHRRRLRQHLNKSCQCHPADSEKTTTGSLLMCNRKQSLATSYDKIEERADDAESVSNKHVSEAKMRADPKAEPVSAKVHSKKKTESKCQRLDIQVQQTYLGDKLKSSSECESTDSGDSWRQEAARKPKVNFELNRDLDPDFEQAAIDAEIDATRMLRQLNRDAINAASGQSGKVTRPSRKQRRSKNPSKNRSNADRASAPPVFAKHCHKSEKSTDKKKKAKSKKEKKRQVVERSADRENHIRFDSKHVHRLKKKIGALRLQQDRENIQRYLHEMKAMRSGLGQLGLPKFSLEDGNSSGFLPLDFPKIAAFSQTDKVHPDVICHDQIGGLHQKISTIRQWIKDQYMLYRDYCNLAQMINTEYVPTNLSDAKKRVYELKRTRTEIR